MTLAVVTGTGRCGSTLVQELLCRHPAIGFVSGLDDKLPKLNLRGKHNGRLYRAGAPRPSGMTSLAHSRKLLEKGRLRVAPSEAYNLLDRHVMAGFSEKMRDRLHGVLADVVVESRSLDGFDQPEADVGIEQFEAKDRLVEDHEDGDDRHDRREHADREHGE